MNINFVYAVVIFVKVLLVIDTELYQVNMQIKAVLLEMIAVFDCTINV